MNEALEGLRIRTGDWGILRDACMAIRREVFVLEQGVPDSIEIDGRDDTAIHVLASLRDEPVGTGRLLPDGQIGRLAVGADWRGAGVGGAMLALLIEEARERGFQAVTLNSQLHACGFYEAFGFQAIGEPFVVAGLDHRKMSLKI